MHVPLFLRANPVKLGKAVSEQGLYYLFWGQMELQMKAQGSAAVVWLWTMLQAVGMKGNRFLLHWSLVLCQRVKLTGGEWNWQKNGERLCAKIHNIAQRRGKAPPPQELGVIMSSPLRAKVGRAEGKSQVSGTGEPVSVEALLPVPMTKNMEQKKIPHLQTLCASEDLLLL